MSRTASYSLIFALFASGCAEQEDDAIGSSGGASNGGGAASAQGGAGAGGSGAGPTTTVCGDGMLATSEECDDGNLVPGDGCSAECTFEPSGPGDICPGIPLELTMQRDGLFVATATAATALARDQYFASCGGSGSDVVYELVAPASGELTARISADFDAVVHARTDCSDANSELACADDGLVGEAEQLVAAVVEGEPLYLFVDGYGGDAGTFSLDLRLVSSVCGDGKADAPEECDDGDVEDGDGCSSTCTIEPGGVVDACPGQTFVLSSGSPTAPRRVSILGDTSSLALGLSPTSCSGSGRQAVIGVVPDVDGHMRVDLVASYDEATVHVRSECDTVLSQLDCAEALLPDEPTSVTVPVSAESAYYVFIDAAWTDSGGPYAVDITVTPGECGNHELDGGESCDDGNVAGNDGCNAACGLVPLAGVDTCPGVSIDLTADAPSAVMSAATSLLAPNYQGSGCASTMAGKDGVFRVTSPIDGLLSVEVDPTFDAAVYLRSDCTAQGSAAQLACADELDGNGTERVRVPALAGQTFYAFVDSNSSAQEGVFELRAMVTPPVCDNGVLEGGEECEDGNVLPGDGCAEDCRLEPVGAEDTCSGESLALVQNGAVYEASVYSGITNLNPDVSATGCGSAGRDAVFDVVAPITGVLTLTVPSASFDVSLHARRSCNAAASQIGCADEGTSGSETLRFLVDAGQSYSLFVDSPDSNATGWFAMVVSIAEPECGDAFINGTDACDDGNAVNGDGCSATCALEPLAGNDTCPGHVVVLSDSDPLAVRTAQRTTNNATLSANAAASCGGSGRDAVYAVTSDVSGTLRARLDVVDGFDAVLHARSTCTDVTSELACDDDPTSGYELTLPVVANVPTYLFVDALSGEIGVSTLTLTVTP